MTTRQPNKIKLAASSTELSKPGLSIKALAFSSQAEITLPLIFKTKNLSCWLTKFATICLAKEPHSFCDLSTLPLFLLFAFKYSKYFYEHLDSKQGICWLYGKTGKET